MCHLRPEDQLHGGAIDHHPNLALGSLLINVTVFIYNKLNMKIKSSE